jgi:hypothetical protein
MSQYESRRARNILQNEEVLRKLGLDTFRLSKPPRKKSAVAKKPHKEAKPCKMTTRSHSDHTRAATNRGLRTYRACSQDVAAHFLTALQHPSPSSMTPMIVLKHGSEEWQARVIGKDIAQMSCTTCLVLSVDAITTLAGCLVGEWNDKTHSLTLCRALPKLAFSEDVFPNFNQEAGARLAPSVENWRVCSSITDSRVRIRVYDSQRNLLEGVLTVEKDGDGVDLANSRFASDASVSGLLTMRFEIVSRGRVVAFMDRDVWLGPCV